MGSRIPDLVGASLAVVHELTDALREHLPRLLRERYGDQWKCVVWPDGKSPRFASLDFLAALDVLRSTDLLPANRRFLLRRCRDFRHKIAHQAPKLSVLGLKHGRDDLLALRSSLGLPLPHSASPALLSCAAAPSIASAPLVTRASAAAFPATPDVTQLEHQGDDFIARGRFTEAADAFGRAMRTAHPTPSLLLKRSAACAKLGEWVLAQQDAEDALELDASAADAYIALGDALVAQSKTDEALSVFERGKAAAPRDARLALRVRDITARHTSAVVNAGMSGDDLLPGQSLPLASPSDTDMYREGAVVLDTPADRERWYARFQTSQQFVIAGHQLRDDGKIVEAVASYERAIAVGNAEAMYNAANLMLPSRHTVIVDAGRAQELYRRAAAEPPGFIIGDRWIRNLGVAEAENALGCMYRDGNGVDVDGSAARSWFVRGARHGNVWAQNSLGCCFLDGVGGDVDGTQARSWFEKAATRSLSAAQLNLGLMLLHGEGGPRDAGRARVLLQAAADGGQHRAMEELARMDATGARGAPRPQEATARLRAAAEAGDVEAMADYAEALMKGFDGAPADSEAAEAMFALAASRGHVPSKLRLGRLLSATPTRAAEGYAHYLSAAEKGSPVAQYEVGVALLDGVGVAVDVAGARRWLLRAKHQGVAAADAALERAKNAPAAERMLTEHEMSRGVNGVGMTIRDRSVRMLHDLAPLDGAEAMRALIAQLGRTSEDLHPSGVQPRPLPWHEAVKQVARRADMGSVTARRFMHGMMELIAAVADARASHHTSAVSRLTRAYAIDDLLIMSSDDRDALDASITATLDATPDDANALFCWCKLPTPDDKRRSISTLVQVLQRAVSLHPANAALRELFGCMLCFAKEWSAALLHFNRVLVLDPQNRRGSDIYYFRGICHAFLPGGGAAATEDLLQFVQTAPPDARKRAEAWYKLAELALAMPVASSAETAAESGSGSLPSEGAYARAAGYYANGVAAERDRLPVHPIVTIPTKTIVKSMLDLHAVARSRIRSAERPGSGSGNGCGSGGGDTGASPPSAAPVARGLPCAVCEHVSVPMRCSRCHVVVYCSKQCQRADWRIHKLSCTST